MTSLKILWLILSFPLWCEGGNSLINSLDAEKDNDDLILQNSLDYRLHVEGHYDWNLSLFLQLDPPEYGKSDRPLFLMGGSLESSSLSVGRLVLKGQYDIIENESFPSLKSWTLGALHTVEKGTCWDNRFGMVLYTKDKSLHLHYLSYPDYEQFGIMIHPQKPGDSFLLEGFGGLFLTQSRSEEPYDESWYEPDVSYGDEDIIHGTGTIMSTFYPGKDTLALSLRGLFSMPEYSLSGYQLFFSLLYDSQMFEILFLAGHMGGSWRSCSDIPADWSGGTGLLLSLFPGQLINCDFNGNITLPGFYSQTDNNNYTWELGFNCPFFQCKGGNDYRAFDTRRRYWFTPALFFRGQNGSCRLGGKWLWDEVSEQSCTMAISRDFSFFSLEGSGKVIWEEFNWNDMKGEGKGKVNLSFSEDWYGEVSLDWPFPVSSPSWDTLKLHIEVGRGNF